MVKTPYLLICV